MSTQRMPLGKFWEKRRFIWIRFAFVLGENSFARNKNGFSLQISSVEWICLFLFETFKPMIPRFIGLKVCFFLLLSTESPNWKLKTRNYIRTFFCFETASTVALPKRSWKVKCGFQSIGEFCLTFTFRFIWKRWFFDVFFLKFYITFLINLLILPHCSSIPCVRGRK